MKFTQYSVKLYGKAFDEETKVSNVRLLSLLPLNFGHPRLNNGIQAMLLIVYQMDVLSQSPFVSQM